MHDESTAEASLIEAVHAGRVGSVAASTDGSLAARTVEACEAIGAHRDTIADEVRSVLEAAGIAAEIRTDGQLPQRHTIDARVADVATADAAASVLQPSGFEPWQRWRAGARRSFERHGDLLTVARTDVVTSVVRLRWRASAPRTRVQRLVRPTAGDWHLVTLPTWAWWAYPVVRLGRQLTEKLVPSRRHAASLGPFLTTPATLLDPLLDLVGVVAGDRVIDLGCGDGRLPIAAANRGAISIGVEQDTDLVARARRRVAEADLDEAVTIEHGDARFVDLADVDVVFAFLPADVFADLLPGLLERLRPGTRLLFHEQHRLPASIRPRPDHTDLVVGPDAVTVAHRWIR